MKKLTPNQIKFKNNVLKGMKPQKAYEKVYKARGKVAYSAAQRLLKNVDIKAEIQQSQQRATQKAELTEERILKEEMCLAFVDPANVFCLQMGTLLHPKDYPEELRRAISGIDVIDSYAKGGDKITKYKIRFWDKGRSLERLAKIKGMLSDTVNHKLDGESLDAILTGLPESFARAVRASLGKQVSKKRN